MKLDEVVMPNRDRILQTAAYYGAHSIRVFGSVARRQDEANSDIDFLVEMEPDMGTMCIIIGVPLVMLVIAGLNHKKIYALLLEYTIMGL